MSSFVAGAAAGRRVLTAAVVLGLLAGVAAAQDPWEYRIAAGEYAFAAGDLERAENHFRAALELAQRLPAGDRRLETSLGNLARLCEHESRLDEAQPLYELLLAARAERVGDGDPALLDVLVAVARVSSRAGDAPTAEASLRRYLEIARLTGAAEPGQQRLVLGTLARIRSLVGAHDEALELERRAVGLLAEDRAAGDDERADELETLARMELAHGVADNAERLLERAAELRSADPEYEPSELFAESASIALGAARPEVAERLAERALAAAADGADPLPAVRVLADVSWLEVRRGGSIGDLLAAAADDPELATAEARLRRLVELEDPATPELYDRLARIAALRGDAAGAAEWMRRELAALEGAGVGDESLLAARGELVAMLAAAGRPDQAAAENSLLLDRIEAFGGADDARLVPVLERQRELLAELGRKKEARAIGKRLRSLERARR